MTPGGVPTPSGPEGPKAGPRLVRYWGSHFKSARQAQAAAKGLAHVTRHGWRLTLVLSDAPLDPSWMEPITGASIDVEYLPRAHHNFDWACVRRVRDLCRRLEADVFHCDNIHTSPLMGAAWAGVPVRIWHKRSMQPAFEAVRPPELRSWLAPSVRVSCYLATKVLTVSNAVRDELVGLGLSGAKIQTFPNPQSRLAFPTGGRERARAALGYGPGELVISTVGHSVPVKAWDVLVRAFGEVAQSRPEARLLLVGGHDAAHERPTFAELRAWIEPRGLSGRIRFLGHVENVAEPLQASDVFVLPSRSEGHSNALLDGLAAGLPVIASRVGAASEVIRNGENGILVDREDTAALVLALDRLLGDADLRRLMGEAARQPLDLPTPDQYTERLFSVYRDLLQGAGPESAFGQHRSRGTR